MTRSSSLTPELLVCAISRPRKRSVTLTLSPSSKKPLHGLHLDVVIVVVDAGPELDLLDLDGLLLLARLGRLLLLEEAEPAVIEDLADRGDRVRGDLDEVEAGVLGELQGIEKGTTPLFCPS